MATLKHIHWQLLLAVFIAVLLAVVPAFAQYDTGSIVGTVLDQQGAALAKASVKVTNVGTSRVWSAITNDQGEYAVPGLPQGTYRVEATQAGFASGIVSEIVLYATDVRRVDVTLKVGAASEQLTVAAQQTTVNTQTSELGATIDAKRVQDLPLNGRDFTQLLTLVPGSVTSVAPGQGSLGGFENTFAGVNFLLDGADATRIDVNATDTDLARQGARITRASVDSVQEFKVIQSTYSAEFGRSMGDVVNVITKSGQNTLHGSLFEYFRNNALDANNYFSTTSLPLRLNQFGGNLGGPIKRDKLFFFFNYEGVRQINTAPVETQVLNAAERAKAVPAMVPVINAIPRGDCGPVNANLDCFIGPEQNRLREDTGSLKIDWNAAPKDTFSFRYNFNDNHTNTQYGLAIGQEAPSYGRSQFLKGTWNHIFSPNVLNEFGVAYNRPHTNAPAGGGAIQDIFQCVFCDATNQIGLTPGPTLFSLISPQYSFQILNTTSWIKGRHSFKFGTDIRHNNTQRATLPQVFLGYAGVDDFVHNNLFQVSTLGFPLEGITNNNLDFFFQDDFRLTHNLTLNLGLRYEYNTVLQGPGVANFDLATLKVLPAGQPLYQPDHNNFAPRVGFSWDPFGRGKTVVRGGFGIFYNPQLTGAALSLAQNAFPTLSVNIFQLLFGTVTCTPFTFGYPISPSAIPSCSPQQPSVNILDPHMRDTYSEHWSFGIQQQLIPNTVLEVAYVGNHGVKLPAGAADAGLELNIPPFSGAAPRLSPNYFNIRQLGDFLKSRYDSMQVSVRRRIGQGLNVDVNYTWSHEFDDAVNIFSAFQNSLNPMGDYSVGDIDVRNNFTLGLVYDVPVASWLPKNVAKGWQVSSIFQARSGLPVNVTMSTPFLGLDLIRPNLVPGQSIYPANYSVPNNQLNPAAFVAPAANSYGDLPRNAARGPGFEQLDLSLAKTTALTERLGLQIRVETFNLFNHPNFQNPANALSESTFGQSTSTIGSLVGVGTPRQTQLALKLIF